MKFIAFDLETTGTVPGADAIVEIGAVRFDNFQVEAIYSTLVNPRKPIPATASKVNGLSDDMVANKPIIEDLLPSFAEFCGDLPMVAHNASFDAQFLTNDIKKFETVAPKGVILDTLPIARKILPGLANYKLGTLVQHLKIPSSEFHRAEADATYCGKLFIELLNRITSGGQTPRIRGILQFALRIAFRCVLHRCENRDIHGYQLFGGFCMFCGQQRMTSIKVMGSGFEFREPPSVYRGEVSLRRRVSKRASPFTPLRCVCLSEPRP